MKTVIVYGPYDEFHEFNRFNANLYHLKQRYDNHNWKMITVVPHCAACIIDNTDICITASTDYLKKYDANFPNVLNYMGWMERYDKGYNETGFMKDSYSYIEKNYKKQEEDILKSIVYTNEPLFKIKEYMPAGSEIYIGENSACDNFNNIIKDFKLIGKRIEESRFIKAFEIDRKRIYEKYKDFFTGNDLIVLTRNFKNKQPKIYNTPDCFEHLFLNLISKGINIINVGFPPKSFNIQDSLYKCIGDDLSYSEFLCLSSMAKAILIKADSGGFSTHMATKLNLFLYGEEWERPDLLYNYRKTNNELITEKISYNKLDNLISFMKEPQKEYNDFFRGNDNIITLY